MQEEIKKLFFKNINIDNDIISYVYDTLNIIDYQDNEELSALFEFINEINNKITFEHFIKHINYFYQFYKNNNDKNCSNGDNIITFKYSCKNKIDNQNEETLYNLIEEPIINKKTIVDKYSLIEEKDSSYKPIVKFESGKKVRYLNNRVVSTKGEKFVDI